MYLPMHKLTTPPHVGHILDLGCISHGTLICCRASSLIDFQSIFLYFLHDCVFTKNFSDTSLHVYWTGALRISGCNACCKLWYFTFNGAECSAPLSMTELSTCRQAVIKISIASAILRGTVITSTKGRCAWDSGSEIAPGMETLMGTQDGGPCPVCLLRKFPKLKLKRSFRLK